MSSASRWSLMIDPQLQGIKWIVNKETNNGLVIIQQSQPKYIDQVINCIENGYPLLIENLPVDIDAVLEPVIGKMTIKKGRNLIVKIGDTEVSYDPRFRLYLQVTPRRAGAREHARGVPSGRWPCMRQLPCLLCPPMAGCPCRCFAAPQLLLLLLLAAVPQTKLSNPHYKPEVAAQTTLVNFCVTEKGLEDQLLALVVDHERPDLQDQVRPRGRGCGG